MKITYDPAKRLKTINARGLDFVDASIVFSGKYFTIVDDRKNYGEPRFSTFGTLGGDVVVVIWTPRDNSRRIISMRKANEREKRHFKKYLG